MNVFACVRVCVQAHTGTTSDTTRKHACWRYWKQDSNMRMYTEGGGVAHHLYVCNEDGEALPEIGLLPSKTASGRRNKTCVYVRVGVGVCVSVCVCARASVCVCVCVCVCM